MAIGKGRMSTVLKALYKIIIDGVQDFVISGECPPTRVYYENNDNNSEILMVKITNIDSVGNIITVSNKSGVSLYIQSTDLTNRTLTNGKQSIYIEKHMEEITLVPNDRLKVSSADINKFNIGDDLSLEIPNSIYLKADILNLPSYKSRKFYKNESFILSCEIKTRNDSNSFELEDITDCIKDVIEGYNSNIPIGNGKYVKVIDDMKVFDSIEEGTVIQKRVIKLMLGYSVINNKYTS